MFLRDIHTGGGYICRYPNHDGGELISSGGNVGWEVAVLGWDVRVSPRAGDEGPSAALPHPT